MQVKKAKKQKRSKIILNRNLKPFYDALDLNSSLKKNDITIFILIFIM